MSIVLHVRNFYFQLPFLDDIIFRYFVKYSQFSRLIAIVSLFQKGITLRNFVHLNIAKNDSDNLKSRILTFERFVFLELIGEVDLSHAAARPTNNQKFLYNFKIISI